MINISVNEEEVTQDILQTAQKRETSREELKGIREGIIKQHDAWVSRLFESVAQVAYHPEDFYWEAGDNKVLKFRYALTQDFSFVSRGLDMYSFMMRNVLGVSQVEEEEDEDAVEDAQESDEECIPSLMIYDEKFTFNHGKFVNTVIKALIEAEKSAPPKYDELLDI